MLCIELKNLEPIPEPVAKEIWAATLSAVKNNGATDPEDLITALSASYHFLESKTKKQKAENPFNQSDVQFFRNKVVPGQSQAVYTGAFK